MKRVPIPDDVKRFILVSIPSIPYLEAMLLLRGEQQRGWNSQQVAQRLYLRDKAADELLEQLHAAGILRAASGDTAGYCYDPVSDDLRAMIDRLADIYAKNLVDVTNLVHSTTGRKAQQFADAFKWRKDS